MQYLKKSFTCPITTMASLVEIVFTLARGSFLLWTPKTLRNLLRFSKYFNNPLDRVTIFSLFYTYIFHSVISNHQQQYRKGPVFSKRRKFLIKHPEYPVPWNYFSISCIPITFSSNIPYPGNFFCEYPVSRKTLIGPQYTWPPKRKNAKNISLASQTTKLVWKGTSTIQGPGSSSVFKVLMFI